MALYKISKEETANSITHGLGALLSIIGTIYYLRIGLLYGNILQISSLLLFGLSLSLLYSFSTIYHFSKENTTFKSTMQKLDHSAIFLLIAGSYTPIMCMTVGRVTGSIILAIVWTIGLFGIFLELFNLMRSKKLSLALYLIMGWTALFVIKSIYLNMPILSFILLVSGGVFYTLGVYFYVQKKKGLLSCRLAYFCPVGKFISLFLCVDFVLQS